MVVEAVPDAGSGYKVLKIGSCEGLDGCFALVVIEHGTLAACLVLIGRKKRGRNAND